MTRTPKPVTVRQLKKWRKALGLTQAEAAAWYGTSIRTWGRFEQGTTPIPNWLVLNVRDWQEAQREEA